MARTKMTEEQKEEKARIEKEKRTIDLLASHLADLRYRINSIGTVSEPTIMYNVGDEVFYGLVKKSIVTEVLDGGKIYKLHQVCTEPNYGKPYDYERDLYSTWMELRPCSAEPNPVSVSFSREEFAYERISFTNTSVESLIQTYYSAGIDLDVKYQRGFVWSLEQKQKLIDSIMKNIPIGSIILNRLPDSCKGKYYEAIDGKQRISTLVEFYEGRFPYKGIIYRNLSGRDRRFFKDCALSKAETSCLNEIQKMSIFVKFNTCGQPQDPNHLLRVKNMMKELIVSEKRDDLSYLIEDLDNGASDKDTVVKVGGKMFRCENCNCNVFKKPSGDQYKCNGCGAVYKGE